MTPVVNAVDKGDNKSESGCKRPYRVLTGCTKIFATSATNFTLACSRRGGRRADDDGCDDEDWRSGELVLRAVTVSLAAFLVGGDVAEEGSAVVTK